MRLRNGLLILPILFALSSCGIFSSSPKETANVNVAPIIKSDAGLRYQMHYDAPGETLQPGKIVTLGLVMRSSGDSVLTDTYAYGQPVQFQLAPDPVAGSFEQGLTLLSMGDSATIYINTDTLFQNANLERPEFLEPGDDLIYTVKVLNSMTYQEYSDEMDAKAALEEAREIEMIETYISKKKLGATKMEKGPYRVVTAPGDGPELKKGDNIKVHYKGYLLDGTVFDNSFNRGEPIAIQLGASQVISGWDFGLIGLHEGEKATLVVPSNMAYGTSGRPGIPPNAPLVFEVEVVELQ